MVFALMLLTGVFAGGAVLLTAVLTAKLGLCDPIVLPFGKWHWTINAWPMFQRNVAQIEYPVMIELTAANLTVAAPTIGAPALDVLGLVTSLHALAGPSAVPRSDLFFASHGMKPRTQATSFSSGRASQRGSSIDFRERQTPPLPVIPNNAIRQTPATGEFTWQH